jgi:predicted DNA-binding protein
MGQVLLPALVTVRTRIDSEKADRLDELAQQNDRSIAAELRIAIDAHLEAAEKDGRNG